MNALGEKWMAKQLYEECLICDGAGRIDGSQKLCLDPPSAFNRTRGPDGLFECPGCGGKKFTSIGMTVGQLERMRAELDRLKAKATAS